MSIAGLGLVLWSLIEAPVRGWSSPLVIGAGRRRPGGPGRLRRLGAGQLAPDAEREFFRRRRFSAAVCSVGLVMFGLFGALFVLTQYLQFSLGYSALQAGVRVLPAAGAIAVIAPLSTVLVRAIGTKLTVAAGLLVIAAGLWQVSTASAATTYTGVLPGMILLGIGAGLTIPSATESVMGSLPGGHTGVGSATNGAFLQIGGALGVAVIGSLLNTRYQGRMTRHADALPRPARGHAGDPRVARRRTRRGRQGRRRPRRGTGSPGPFRLRQRDGPGPGDRRLRRPGRLPHRPDRPAVPGTG